jgi:hypothetical protein
MIALILANVGTADLAWCKNGLDRRAYRRQWRVARNWAPARRPKKGTHAAMAPEREGDSGPAADPARVLRKGPPPSFHGIS